MGNWTFCTLNIPENTPMNGKIEGFDAHHINGSIEYTLTEYSTSDLGSVIPDLVDVLGPLTEVPGLYLYIEHKNYDDGFDWYVLEIRDGHATYKESEIVMKEYPIDEGCVFGTIS